MSSLKKMGRILVLPYILVLFLKADAQGIIIDIKSFGRPTAAEVSVCVDDIPTDTETFVLLTKSDTPVSAEILSVDNKCIPFAWNIANNLGETRFILNALDSGEYPLGTGTEDVDIPEFPSLMSTIGSRILLSEEVLRIKGDKKSFTYTVNSDITATDVSAVFTGYYIGLQSVTEVVPCDETTNNVPVCDIPIPKTSITFKNSINVVKAILKYNEDSVGGAEITIDITGDANAATPALDIIINFPTTTPVLCLGNNLIDQKCTIASWTPGSTEVDIRLVQTSDGELFDYKKHTITDCEVLAGGIDATTLEVRWLQFGSKNYQLTATEDAGSVSLGPLIVDCTALTLNHCFAYFTIDTGGLYSVTVQEIDTTVITDSQVQSKLYEMPPPTRSTIQHIDAAAHRNGSEARTTVCFQQTSQETLERTFSHYELVILNYKGQWLKHKLMTHEIKGYLCFTPFIVYTNEFDTSKGAKIIVTQRAEDGFTVLASGNTQVTF